MKNTLVALGCLAATLALFVGLFVRVHEFHYLNFEDTADLSVERVGTFGWVHLSPKIPQQYKLVREGYVVEISLGVASGVPRAYVHATASDGSALPLQGVETDKCFYHFYQGEADQLLLIMHPKSKDTFRNCIPDTAEEENVNLQFRVRDQYGILHEERMPFVVERSGYILSIDSL